MNDKEFEKLEKALGKETMSELEALDNSSLEQRVVAANQAMKQVAEELQANPKFQELKESLKALSAGKRDVNKRQNAVIKYCLQLLTDKGAE